MTQLVFDEDATTDVNVGTFPNERDIEQRLASGFVLIDKPAGPTSHQLSAWIRDLFELERLGHGGTLDPFATGVLPLLFGRGMKVTSKILEHEKTYIAVFRFKNEMSAEELQAQFQTFTGRIYNVPPEISAVKVQVRTRVIHEFELIDSNDSFAVARIRCEAGTYIRTIARDLGLVLNTPVELKELRRSSSGSFDLEQCVTLDQLADAYWLWKEHGKPEALLKMVHPIERLLDDVPICVVKDSAVAALSHGAPLLRPGLISIPADIKAGDDVYVMSLKGEAVAMVTMLMDAVDLQTMEQGEVARPNMVLIDADIYPRRWSQPE